MAGADTDTLHRLDLALDLLAMQPAGGWVDVEIDGCVVPLDKAWSGLSADEVLLRIRTVYGTQREVPGYGS